MKDLFLVLSFTYHFPAFPFLPADQALIGYCKIIAEINRNKYVMRYRHEPRLTEKGKHEFKVYLIIYCVCTFSDSPF